MKIPETLARQIILAQAVETSDVQGKFISDLERDQIDSRIAKEMRPAGGTHGTDADTSATLGATLAKRAAMVLDIAEGRNRVVAGLQRTRNLQHAMAWVIPVCAFVLGVVVDRVVNPSRVDLLSETFLGLLVWNLVVYAAMLLSIFRRTPQQSGWLMELLRHGAASVPLWRPAGGSLGTAIAIQFSKRWQTLTASLTQQRMLYVMHLAAAALAAGTALSLILRGTVKAYTIGWESTLLSAQQVHVVLSILSWPLVQVFGMDPFTIDDVARLQFDTGVGKVGNDGSRWLWMYVGLMLAVVVLPRLLLAALSAWRARQLAQHITLDLDAPYFQRIIDNLSPAAVTLGVLAHHADDLGALQYVLNQETRAQAGPSARATHKLLETERGDALWTTELNAKYGEQHPTPSLGNANRLEIVSWQNWRNWIGTATAAPDNEPSYDVVLHIVSQVSDLADALPVLQALRRPVLMLVRSKDNSAAHHAELLGQCKLHQRNNDLSMDILDFEAFASCWVQEHALLEAIARHVPRARTQGYARLTSAWEQRSQKRFTSSVEAMVETLTHAARQSQEIPKLSLIDRVSSDKRQARATHEQTAMAAVLARVQLQDQAYVQKLLSTHSLASDAASALTLDGKFAIQSAVSAPRAAMGGAASGAAMGASIDLLTGGLTLGAAAALGALAGGSFAFAGALWNNRTAPNGGTRVSLSDDMLMALAQACLLRYLAVIHLQRDTSGLDPEARQEFWNNTAAEALQSHKKHILQLLDSARTGDSAQDSLTSLMVEMTHQVLQKLYPVARF